MEMFKSLSAPVFWLLVGTLSVLAVLFILAAFQLVNMSRMLRWLKSWF